MRWVWRGSALAALAIGWLFIAWQNHFHITAPVVFICLGYLAVVATVYNLWRTGAAAVATDDDGADSTWAKPAGALGELEREKRTLLKAIKEAEFDQQMEKLSQRDAEDMIRGYRARAIEVIKEIDRFGNGAPGSAREQILREVRARLELEARSQKKPRAAEADARSNGKKKPGKAAADAAIAEGSAVTPPRAGEAAVVDPELADGAASEPAPATAVQAAAQAAAQTQRDDEDLDADSTTAVEPKRDGSAKEASP
jgi:hypothetical protein